MDWRLLKQVSRSFYLTLRLLPAQVRESIALAYLLARFTDTQADGAVTEAERELLGREGELRFMLARSPDRADIETVWATIQEGQRFDGVRFQNPRPLTSEELDRYTYLVAGCVGEFWTRLCMRKVPGYAARSLEDMLPLGIHFGKGLQLVNILRDRHEDALRGRIYVPTESLPEALATARRHLRDARDYVSSLGARRMRAACALPLFLAEETLDLIEKAPDQKRVKVGRYRVWWLLVRALAVRPVKSSPIRYSGF